MSARDQIILWTNASLHIADIRFVALQPLERFDYLAPAELFLVSASGQAWIRAGSVRQNSENAPVVHIGKGTTLHLEASASGYEYYLIMYKASLPQALPGGLVDPSLALRQFHASYAVAAETETSYRNMANQMYQLWREEHPLSRLEAKKQFFAFAHLLLKESERRERRLEQAEEAETDKIDSAVRYMEAYYGEPWTLASLAERLGTNLRQLQRGFKTRFGHSPMEHLIRVRMEKAKELLEKNERPISRIAEEIGYPDSYYFSRLFKKYSGLSPRGYRQAKKKERRIPGEVCRISPILPSQTTIVPSGCDEYDQVGSVSDTFQALLSLTMLCTGGIAHYDGKLCIPHLRGTTELGYEPRRIAVLDYQYADQLLALGILPVGSAMCSLEHGGLPADLSEPLSRMAHLGKKEEPNMRLLAALEPELIICTSFQEHRYADLSAMAPTIMLDRNEDWRQSLLRLGVLVGRTRQALEQIDAYNAKLARLRRQIGNSGSPETVALIRPRDGGIRLHTERHRTARLLYEGLGLVSPALALDQPGTSSLIPLDELPRLKADRLFVLIDNTNREQIRLYQQCPVWKEMNAVRAGQVRHFHTALWTGYYGPLAMSRVVDEIAEALLSPS